jgi:hypothetical protein
MRGRSRPAFMSADEPIASGGTRDQIATSRATLRPLALTTSIASRNCSGIPREVRAAPGASRRWRHLAGPAGPESVDAAVGPEKVSAPTALPSTDGRGLLSWKPSAANSKGDAADQRPGADGQDATDQTGLPLPLPSSAPTREKTRPPRPTAGTPHGVPILDKAGRNWPETGLLLTGRSTSMLPMTGLPSSTGFIHARSGEPCRIWTSAGSRPPGCCGCNPKIQAAAMGGCGACASRGT